MEKLKTQRAPIPSAAASRSPPAHWSPLLLALGVLSHARLGRQRRTAVRSSWGGHFTKQKGGREALMRFVIGKPDEPGLDAITTRESADFGDILKVSGGGSEDSHGADARYAFKAISWMHRAARWRPRYVGLADDDAYVFPSRVLGDLSFLHHLDVKDVVYGRFEWSCYMRDTGHANACWGRDAFGSTFAWRHATGVNEDVWPGRLDAGVRVRARGEARMIAQLQRHKRSFSPPFPFLRGPLMVWSASVAAALAGADNDMAREQKHARALFKQPQPPKRLLVDIFFGHLLASARNGFGLPNLSLVDISQGYLELRQQLMSNISRPLPGARVLHLNSRHVEMAARRRGGGTADQVLSEHMSELSRGDRDQQPRLARFLHCSQRNWWNATGYVVLTGASWTSCDLTGSAWTDPRASPLFSPDEAARAAISTSSEARSQRNRRPSLVRLYSTP